MSDDDTSRRARQQAYANSVYVPDPAELTPEYRAAWAEALKGAPLHRELLRQRAARGDVEAALAILAKAPDVPPDEGDELPEGVQG